MDGSVETSISLVSRAALAHCSKFAMKSKQAKQGHVGVYPGIGVKAHARWLGCPAGQTALECRPEFVHVHIIAARSGMDCGVVKSAWKEAGGRYVCTRGAH